MKNHIKFEELSEVCRFRDFDDDLGYVCKRSDVLKNDGDARFIVPVDLCQAEDCPVWKRWMRTA